MRQFGKLFFLEYLENAFDADKLTFFGALKPLPDRRAFPRSLKVSTGRVFTCRGLPAASDAVEITQVNFGSAS
jgi:hypothetical protein